MMRRATFIVWSLALACSKEAPPEPAPTPPAGPLVDPRPISPEWGGLMGPRFAPDGRTLVASTGNHDGLYVIERESGKTRLIAKGAFLGYNARFDGREVRTRDADGNLIGVSLDGATRALPPEPAAAAIDDDDVIRAGDRVLSPPGDRYFGPKVSPDGTWVVFQGLVTGLHVVRLDGTGHVAIGAGDHPEWSPDSATIVFDRSTDDGERLLTSDLYIYGVLAGSTTRLTDTESLEQRPVFSADGHSLAWDADGRIWVADYLVFIYFQF